MLVDKSGHATDFRHRHMPVLEIFNATASFSGWFHIPANSGAESFQVHIVLSQNSCTIVLYR